MLHDINERLERVQHRLNQEYVYPKDRLKDLSYDDQAHRYIFPDDVPQHGSGNYISVLKEALCEEFPGCAVRCIEPEIPQDVNKTDLVIPIFHKVQLIDIDTTYQISVYTEVYREHIPSLIVQIKMALTSQHPVTVIELKVLVHALHQDRIRDLEKHTSALLELRAKNRLLMSLTEGISQVASDIVEIKKIPSRSHNQEIQDITQHTSTILEHMSDEVREYRDKMFPVRVVSQTVLRSTKG